jgi:hypothetical protein
MEESMLLNKYEMVSLHDVNLKMGADRELSVHPTFKSLNTIREDGFVEGIDRFDCLPYTCQNWPE